MLQKMAGKTRKRIVLPEGNDDRVLRAVEILQKKDIVDLVLLGNVDEIKAKAGSLGLDMDFDKTPIIDPFSSNKLAQYATTLYKLRKAKGLTEEMATDLMHDVSYYGTMMVHKGAQHDGKK